MAIEVKFKEKQMKKSTTQFADFISYLLRCNDIVNMFRFTNSSFVIHKHCGEYLECSGNIIYCLGKQITSYYGKLEGFVDYPLKEYEGIDVQKYFEELRDYIDKKEEELFKDAPKPIGSEINKLRIEINNFLFHIKVVTK